MKASKQQATHYDIIIVGGGLIGLSAALALSREKLSIAVIEPREFQTSIDTSKIGKKLALNIASQRILSALSLWSHLEQQAMPMQKVEVSQQGSFGKTRLKASDHQLPALGYVIEEAYLNHALQQQVLSTPDITVMQQTQAVAINRPQLTIEQQGRQSELSAKLIIIADGSQSKLRQILNFPNEHKYYSNKALVTYVDLEQAHKKVAYQHFLKQGVLALLPLREKTYAVIWMANNERVDKLLQLDDEQFLRQLQEQFGYRLGQLQAVHKRGAYSLGSQYSKQQVQPGVMLLGNSAHTLNPVAAQGFNLGLRCVARLLDAIHDANVRGDNWHSMETLQSYQLNVADEQSQMIFLTDSLVDWFAADSILLKCVRSAGLTGLDLLPPLKRRLAKRMMGLYGKAPRLVSGALQ